MESFATIVNGFKPLSIFAKLSILDVCGSSEFASELCSNSQENTPKIKLDKVGGISVQLINKRLCQGSRPRKLPKFWRKLF